MVGNIKVIDKLVNLVKERPKETVIIVSTGVLIAGIILSSQASNDPKEYFPMMPAPTKAPVVETVKPITTKNPVYMTMDINVALNQVIRLEPSKDSKYVGKIEEHKNAELLYIDGEFALISYTDKKGNTRLGFVETNSIADLDNIGSRYQVEKTNMYGEITINKCRIQNDSSSNALDSNILTRGNKGDYVKIIGEYHDGIEKWYIVNYRNYIGYVKPNSLNVITEEEMFNLVNSRCIEIVGSKVRFRSTPKVDNNIIDEIEKGTKLPVISIDKDWYQVYYKGRYGYVSTRKDCTKETGDLYKPPGLTNIDISINYNKGTI